MIIYYVKKKNVKIETVHFHIIKSNSYIIQVDTKVSIVKNILLQKKKQKDKIIKKDLNHFAHIVSFVLLLIIMINFPSNLLINYLELQSFIYIVIKPFGVLLQQIIIDLNVFMLTIFKIIEEIQNYITINQNNVQIGRKMKV